MSEKEYTKPGTGEPDIWSDQDEVAWYERVNRYLELSGRLWRESRVQMRSEEGTGSGG